MFMAVPMLMIDAVLAQTVIQRGAVAVLHIVKRQEIEEVGRWGKHERRSG
ncbi:MAG: hypothetical protein OXE95_00775 [Chloroflexi bacterium]|nr:hypothetical protein [Chloroflexota bacterium]MCY4246090.1 hypothetical protein [Chloroflexota bacterium]